MFNLAQILQQFQAQPWNRQNFRQFNQFPWMQQPQQGFQPMQGGMNRPTTMPVQGPAQSPVGMPFGNPQQPIPMPQPTQGSFMPYQGGMGPTTMPVQQPGQMALPQQQQFQPMNRFGPAMWRR